MVKGVGWKPMVNNNVRTKWICIQYNDDKTMQGLMEENNGYSCPNHMDFSVGFRTA